MDAQILQGTNPQVQLASSPVQQPLNQNSEFLGYDSFADFFKEWLRTTFGGSRNVASYGSGMPSFGTYSEINSAIAPQINQWSAIANQTSRDPGSPTVPKEPESIYDDVYSWIREAVDAGVDNANSEWLKAAEYNAQEAQKNREWQEYMSNTQYQRAVEDLKKAGINPLLAFSSLTGASTPSGAVADMSAYNPNSLYSGMMSSILGDKKIQVALLTIFSTVISSLVKSTVGGLSALFG